ncbi:MAG: hypothetical protein JNM81_13365, partial [Rhodospirillaceae bacterium]|nr:hypothetical protein [Rhodospirillaceae bacterium]
SLQYGPAAADIERVTKDLRAEIFVDPDINPMGDLDDFAAQVKAMDVVVSVSNTTVHFAGALNVPTLALVPQGRGNLWYFRLGTQVLWYPSVRLLRQDQPQQWQGVVEKVRQSLLGGG